MLVLFSSLCKQSISKAVTDSPGTFSFPSSESCWKPKSQAFLRCFGQNTSLSSTSWKSVRLAVATEPWQHLVPWYWKKKEKNLNFSGHSGCGRNWNRVIQMSYEEISWRNNSRKSSGRERIRKYYFLGGQAVSGAAINVTFWSWLDWGKETWTACSPPE